MMTEFLFCQYSIARKVLSQSNGKCEVNSCNSHTRENIVDITLVYTHVLNFTAQSPRGHDRQCEDNYKKGHPHSVTSYSLSFINRFSAPGGVTIQWLGVL